MGSLGLLGTVGLKGVIGVNGVTGERSGVVPSWAERGPAPFPTGPASVLCRPTNEEVGGTAPPPGPPRLVLSPALPYAALEPFATKVQ